MTALTIFASINFDSQRGFAIKGERHNAQVCGENGIVKGVHYLAVSVSVSIENLKQNNIIVFSIHMNCNVTSQ